MIKKYTVKVKWVLGKLVKIADCSLMSPVGPGNATLNDEEVNVAIHTITKNLPLYQDLRSLYCKKRMKLTTHIVNANIMLNPDGRQIKIHIYSNNSNIRFT